MPGITNLGTLFKMCMDLRTLFKISSECWSVSDSTNDISFAVPTSLLFTLDTHCGDCGGNFSPLDFKAHRCKGLPSILHPPHYPPHYPVKKRFDICLSHICHSTPHTSQLSSRQVDTPSMTGLDSRYLPKLQSSLCYLTRAGDI
jgi:hypothetical protein